MIRLILLDTLTIAEEFVFVNRINTCVWSQIYDTVKNKKHGIFLQRQIVLLNIKVTESSGNVGCRKY